MTSNINYLGINENFPVAGQDNDTQTFRDNFDTIKTSLRNAKDEITDLQNNTAKINEANDFALNTISSAILQNNFEKIVQLGEVPLETATSNVVEVDYQNGSYQRLRARTNIVLTFTNFPGDPTLLDPIEGVGKITLELSSDGAARTIAFSTSGGSVFKKDPDFPAVLTISSTTNPTFIEVWRHRNDEIFLRYLGQYS